MKYLVRATAGIFIILLFEYATSNTMKTFVKGIEK